MNFGLAPCSRPRSQTSLISVSLLIPLTLHSGIGSAQDGLAQRSVDAVLPVVVSTATRTDTSIDAAPGNASVVTKDDIAKTPRASVKELVRNLEGVVTGQLRGQSDLAPEIFLRGLPGQSRTMVLIDGIPLNTSYSGQIQAIGGLNVEDVQQVEVVRGPYSSLYGSSAMGGVVNFITALPNKSEYRVSIGYGDAFDDGRAQKHLIKGYLSAAEKFSEGLKVKVSYGWLDSKGYRSDFATSSFAPTGGVTGAELQQTTTGGTQYIIGNKGDGALDKYDFSVKLELKPSPVDVLNASYVKSYLHNQYNDPESFLRNAVGAPVFSATTTNPARPIRESAFLNNQNDITNEIYALDWKHRFVDSRLNLKLSKLIVDEWYSTAGTTTLLSGGAGTLTPRYSENIVLDALWEKPLGDTLLLIGAQYKTTESLADTYNMTSWTDENSKTNKTTSSGGKERVIAIFGDWQVPLTEKLSGSIGGRFEHWAGLDGFTADYTQPANTTLNRQYESQTHNNFSPKITASYQLREATKLKAAWGTAFRAPDALNLYRNYASGTTTYISNPNLTPETSESVEMGIEQIMPRNGLLKVYAFNTDLTDMISTRDIAANTKERINIGKARSRGLELSLSQPFGNQFKLDTNYTLLDTKVLENPIDPASVGKQLQWMPRHMFNLGVSYDDSTYFGSINYQRMSKRYMNSANDDAVTGVYGAYDPYTLVNAKLGYRINNNFDVSLAISNVLDKKFYNSVLTEGRAWFAQANLKF